MMKDLILLSEISKHINKQYNTDENDLWISILCLFIKTFKNEKNNHLALLRYCENSNKY